MRRILIAVLACAVLAGCSLPRGAPLKAEIVSGNAEKNAGIQVIDITRANLPTINAWPATGASSGTRWLKGTGGPQSAVIRPGDTLSLVIWDADENSLLAAPGQKAITMPMLEVSSAGEVFVPYAGGIVVNGLTPEAAREEIQKEVERVSPNAQVQLNFTPGAMNAVDLVSGMPSPGPLELAGRNVTILTALARGGGVSPSLRNPRVKLIRGSETYSIDAERLFSNAAYNIVLRGGDKIFVDEDERFFTALGAVGSETTIYFNRDRITALEAASMIGGLQDNRVDPTGVLILRDYPAGAVTRDGKRGPLEQQVIFVMDFTNADGLFAARNFEVRPGDTVMAAESPAVALQALLGFLNTGLLIRNRI